jgi:DeoR family transcriptional regulator, fructose operon transcriptional repressor
MHSEERKTLILSHLDTAEFVTIDELTQLTKASVSSVRRDLLALERGKAVQRIHGGARTLQPRTNDYVFDARDTQQVAEKEAIGKACAALIGQGQSILIDSGTTCFHVAKHLGDDVGQIISNSLPVANLFSGSIRREVVVSGGMIYPRLGALIGPNAVDSFLHMHVDVAVLSASGLSEDGLYNSHALVVDIQRAMISSAARVVFCMDHTKFNRRSTFFLTDFAPIDVVVSDQAPPEPLATALRSSGVEIVVAAS